MKETILWFCDLKTADTWQDSHEGEDIQNRASNHDDESDGAKICPRSYLFFVPSYSGDTK